MGGGKGQFLAMAKVRLTHLLDLWQRGPGSSWVLGVRLSGEEGLGTTTPKGRLCREQKGRTNIQFSKAFPPLVQGKPRLTDCKTEPLNTKQAWDKIPPFCL